MWNKANINLKTKADATGIFSCDDVIIFVPCYVLAVLMKLEVMFLFVFDDEMSETNFGE